MIRTLLIAPVCAASLLLAPAANAAPCSASGLTAALGQVSNGTSAFLIAHPDAEAAINTADQNQIRMYFVAHQDQWAQLQGIASPLRDLRNSCPQQVSPSEVATLFNAMTG